MSPNPSWQSEHCGAPELQQKIISSILKAKEDNPFAPVTLVVDNPLQGLLLRRQIAQTISHDEVIATANLKVQTVAEFVEEVSVISGIKVYPQPSIAELEATIYALMEQGSTSSSLQSMPTASAIARLYKKLELVSSSKIQEMINSPISSSTQQNAFGLILKARSKLQSSDLSAISQILLNEVPNLTNKQATAIGQVHFVVSAMPQILHDILTSLVAKDTDVHFHRATSLDLTTPFDKQNSVYISAPDPYTETSIAVRAAIGDLNEFQADRIAILYPDESQYLNQLINQMEESGVAWHGKGRTFGQESVLVRTLEIVLEALNDRNKETSGMDRPKLMRLLQNGHLFIDGIGIETDSVRKLIRKNNLYADSIYWLNILDLEISGRGGPNEQKAVEQLKHLLTFLDHQLNVLAGCLEWHELGEKLVKFLTDIHQNLPTLLPNSLEEQAWGDIKNLLQRELPKLDEIELVSEGELTFKASASHLLRLVKQNLAQRRSRQGKLSAGILIGDLNSANLLAFDSVYVLGATEGILPAAVKNDPFLPIELLRNVGEAGLELLSSESKGVLEELTLANLARSTSQLTVLRPRAGTSTKVEDEPSRFISSELANSKNIDEKLEVESFASSFELLLRGKKLSPVLQKDYSHLCAQSRPTVDQKFQRSMAAWRDPKFDEYFGNLSNQAALGPIWTPQTSFNLSSTRIDSYIKCPYQFFANTVLGFREDDVEDELRDFSANSFGIFLHKLMEDFVNYLKENDQLPNENEGFSESHYTLFERDFLFRNLQRFKSTGRDGWNRNLLFHIETLNSTLPEFFQNEREKLRINPNLAISEAEKSFGKKGDEVKLTVHDSDGTPFNLSGQIDRVDISSDGSAIGIMDFKTGKRPKQVEKLGLIKSGQSKNVWTLQDVIYREAALKIAPNATDIRVHFVFITESPETMFLKAEWAHDPNGLLPKYLKMIKDSGVSGEFHPQGKRATSYDHDYCKTCSYLGNASGNIKDKYKQQVDSGAGAD